MDLYAACCFFLIYSFLGWVIEVVYHAVTLGKIMNRGFLNGPVCPVYGFGMTAVLFMFDILGTDDPVAVFIIGTLLTTVIELTAGWALYTFFHARWWDYSNMPLNLGGYICPAFSIIWGLAVLAVVRIAHPAIEAVTVDLIPVSILLPLIVILMIKRTIATTQSAQTARVQAALAKAELKDAADITKADLEQRYEEIRASILRHRHYGAGRLINVFPNVNHRYYRDILDDIKSKLHSR